ncbi:MAG: crotonyl-CoA carboxylase/reductase [Candidatus Rokubacteria bacterium]|nr:crotonyl-CoA carboxylase/reductase [Candidatus Rokubacteria bacterium]
MWAQVIREERFGEPISAFAVEKIEVPALGPDDVLVCVLAAGINYNNVWAARGFPVDVIKEQRRDGDRSDFHIGGSDASGIVFATGSAVTGLAVGDPVVVHPGMWDARCPLIQAGGDPITSPTARNWGYDTNWGSFGQFARVQAHQCLPKPPHLTWEEAAAYMLVTATAYRMLLGWPPHTVRERDVVLVWGGAGGVGSQAIQITRELGGLAVAVVSSEDKGAFCVKLGAKGFIDRRAFSHWGPMPDWRDTRAYNRWAAGARGFNRAIWEVVGERRDPRIVVEHPGEDTIPTSIFVCDRAGMVVICGGTSGYQGVLDLRHLWTRQKRLQGSHFANDEQCRGANELVARGRLDPCLSRVFRFDEIPLAHQLLHEGKQPPGNMAALVGAPRPGLTGLP